MSDTWHMNGDESMCSCPYCEDYYIDIDAKVTKEGDFVVCEKCKTEFQIRYIDFNIKYGLDRIY
jgi:transposase-like protein